MRDGGFPARSTYVASWGMCLSVSSSLYFCMHIVGGNRRRNVAAKLTGPAPAARSEPRFTMCSLLLQAQLYNIISKVTDKKGVTHKVLASSLDLLTFKRAH